jgi:hypothetical protein
MRGPHAALALAGMTAVVFGVALLPAAASTSPIPSPHPSKSSKPPAKGHGQSGTTVTGPRLYNPVTGDLYKFHSAVTVSQTANLTNQFVRVTWKNFTPSGPAGVPAVYNQALTTYPVMVAECNTVRVKYWDQCYGSNVGGLPAEGPDGPMNTAYATTSGNGTGEVDIQILVAAENQFLGCGQFHRCSLVIVPAQGGAVNPDGSPDCSSHILDQFYAEGQYDFGGTYAQCSWPDRIVVPLSFVAVPKFCPINNAAFTALGSPMLNLAMQQWIGALCTGPHPVAMVYNPSITEPEAVQDLGSGLGDVALTTRPGPAHIDGRTYAFAPLAISAVAIAYWVDSPQTYEPVTTLKLDPRLVAKLLTQSYDFDGDGCTSGPPPGGIGCDSAVDGNPPGLFADPEFRRLNPHVLAPVSATFQVPTVMSGHSDMTWEVTRWIASDTDANAFMHGTFDPWGMHVNTDYLTVHYPVDSFTGQDNFPVIQHKYSPAFPLSAVVQIQAENTDDGTDYEIDPTTGNYPKDPAEFPGARSLFAIVDEGDAASLEFPVAEIRNSSGNYVAPTPKSMAAAVATMTPIGNNGVTEQVDFARQKADAYPLTMVIYAMVPTSGVSAGKAAAIAKFLDYVAGPGQRRGLNVGQLPPGYLPLPAKLQAETRHAAELVLTQAGGTKSPSPSPSPSSSASSSPASGSGSSSSPAGGKTPSASPSASPTPTPSPQPKIITVALKSASAVGAIGYALPALLILGGLAAIGGASSLIAGTAGAAIVTRARRLRRVRLDWRKNS